MDLEELARRHARRVDAVHAKESARWLRARRRRRLVLRVVPWLVPAALAVFVAIDYLHEADEAGWRDTIDPEEVREVLEGVPRMTPPPENDVVSYDDVLEAFHTFDWAGTPPPR